MITDENGNEITEPKKPTQPLGQILATLPSGRQMPPLPNDALEQYLRLHYLKSEPEKARRLRHKKRQDLYSDGGVEYIEKLIDDTYKKAEIRERLKAWARVARFDNPLKRIVNELSTVYSKPAKRTVGKKATIELVDGLPTSTENPEQIKYAHVQRLCRQAERSRQINRLLNVHRSLFVGFRVRAADGRPHIDIVTPDQCFAVTHPTDDTVLIALIIETKFRTAVQQRNAPKYTVWTAHESFFLTEAGVIIEGSYQEHEFGRIPYVYVSLEPATCGFWPGEVGEDLVGAAVSAWFANTNLLKETKSASKFPVVSGDLSTAAREQAADSDEVVETPEGTSITTVDTSMDLDLFTGTSDHVIEHAANNYGMSSAYVKHQGVQSAEARELMRAPLKALQAEQMTPLLEFEHEFAELQAIVLRVVGSPLAFAIDLWAIKFYEIRTPLEPAARLAVFETERRLGLTNTIDYLVEHHGMTEEQAWDLVLSNLAVELVRETLMRPMQAIAGGATPTMKESTDKAKQPVDEDSEAGGENPAAVADPA